MASQAEDDLQASTTEGFKVGEKKTVEEYAKLGQSNPLMNRLSSKIKAQEHQCRLLSSIPSIITGLEQPSLFS